MRRGEMLIDGLFIGGHFGTDVSERVMRSPFDGSLVGIAPEGSEDHILAAIEAAHRAFQSWRFSQRSDRQQLLRSVADLLRKSRDDLAGLASLEIGKPFTLGAAEVDRAAITFDSCAEHLESYGDQAIPTDLDPRGAEYRLRVERVPRGVVLGIVPYNWPFNLSAHKIAPAIATGNTVVLKPAPQASLCTLALARIVSEAGCPAGVFNCVPCQPSHAQAAIGDARVAMLSFTGSPAVGWKLKALAPEKHVTLELGGDASAIVCADSDLEWATDRIVSGAYGYAGQVCISVQHALVERSRYDEVMALLMRKSEACRTGDPTDPTTVCGPMISSEAADRVEAWIQEAVSAGAKVIVGGGRDGNLIRPTLVESVSPHVRLGCEEVFGPVLTVSAYDTIDEAIERVNASAYGIHCGIFTRSEELAGRAFREIDAAGLIVNDAPTMRLDEMPYGGVKKSGFGREGGSYAMDDMSLPKAFLVRER